MKEDEARRIIDRLQATADYARIRFARALRPVDEEEMARQLAHLHGQLARLYREITRSATRAPEDWRNG